MSHGQLSFHGILNGSLEARHERTLTGGCKDSRTPPPLQNSDFGKEISKRFVALTDFYRLTVLAFKVVERTSEGNCQRRGRAMP